MDPAMLKVLIAASILLLDFALGAHATLADATSQFRDLFRPPRRFLPALVAAILTSVYVAIARRRCGD
jgi:hypothetical protein